MNRCIGRFFNISNRLTTTRSINLPKQIHTMSSRFLADTQVPICKLAVEKHFNALSEKEKKYAHHIARGSWLGSKVILAQLSKQSPQLFELILEIFAAPENKTVMRNVGELKKESGVSEENWKYFVEYVSQFLSNQGNYKSFGDTKFIPRIPKDQFAKIVQAAKSQKAAELFKELGAHIYDQNDERHLLLGYPADGHVSGYYSDNVSKEDIEFVQKALESKGISALNTRLFKDSDTDYTILIASAKLEGPFKSFQYNGKNIKIKYGDFSEQMAKVASEMREAVPYAANEHQKNMLLKYAESFETGSIEAHRESQKHWIRDVGPTVESNIGFIETYRDPQGVRAEWEGFAACVNKEMTQKFEKLVSSAPKFIEKLPWPKEFEKDNFYKPDFTSLEVINFATGGIPSGINIPNYDDIRETFGFKNVSLGNVLSAKSASEKITFLSPEDVKLMEKCRGPAFELQVGLHELLGHGSGKLLSEEAPGKFNFDINNPPLSPFTGKPITTWYKPGETWGSVFKSVAASYEECRAETVAIYLCVYKEILDIFGHVDEADDIIYACWLSMARAGLLALEFFDPKTQKWGQAHMQARFAIMKVMIRAGLLRITFEGEDELLLSLDRQKIMSVGHPAVGDFLCKLNVFKSTADTKSGFALYDDLTSVPTEEDGLAWHRMRELVLKHKQPRKMFVQGNSFLASDGSVKWREYEANELGIIQSFVERDLL